MVEKNEPIPVDTSKDIAIVGMSVFFPGAKTLGKFWCNLVDGVDSIIDAPPDVIEPFFFGAKDNKSPDKFYCHRGGFTPHAIVDPVRYGIMPVTAEGSDPDQLMSLMLAEDALLDAGVFQKGISLDQASIIIGRGTFAGMPQVRGGGVVRYSNELVNIIHHALPDVSMSDLAKVKKEYQEYFGRYQADTATSTIPNLPASGVANYFNMHGPAYLIDAACASGIIALEHGIQLLHSGQSDIAIIGSLHSVQNAVFWSAFTLMGALSYKGVIAPFSKDADGLLIGQGAGYLVIKTLQRAIDDEDRIYAVVKGTASGSDGGGHSVLVTNTEGQSAVIRRAWERARMDPTNIGYVEAHGTGTPVGDATEAQTLAQIFGDSTQPKAYVGSVKSNIGHLMPAAGMAGLVKTALSLYHRRIPATLHCENPSSALLKSRFVPPQETIDWEASGLPLIAGVDAFGFGGINSHAVLTAYEEPDKLQIAYRVDRRKAYSPVVYAITAPSLEILLEKLDYKLGKNRVGSFIGSPDDRYRLVIFDPSDERIDQAIEIVRRDKPWLGRSDIWFTNNPMILDGGKVAFMFPGWDSNSPAEHDSIVDELGLNWPEEDAVEQSEEAERQYQQLWSEYAEKTGTDETQAQGRSFAEDIMDRTNMAQLVDEALRKTGVKADLYIGHSIGEWHAARAIGMIDDSAALTMDRFFFDPKNTIPGEYMPDFHSVAISGKLTPEGKARLLAIPDIWLTNDNCPTQLLLCVLGDAVDAVEAVAKEEHVFSQLLPFGSSIHTPMINDVLDVLLQQLAPIELKEGDTPLWSSETRAQIQPNQTADKGFGRQLNEPVQFRQLIGELYEQQSTRVFIQIGGGSLPQFVEDTLKGRPFATISSVQPGRSSVDQLRRVHALMFVEGGAADLDFMGINPIYRTAKSIYFMPVGALLIENLTSLDEACKDYVPKSSIVHEAPAAPVQPVQPAAPAPAQEPSFVPNPYRRGTGILPPRGFTRGNFQTSARPLVAASVSGQTMGGAVSVPQSPAHLSPVPPPSPVPPAVPSSAPAPPPAPEQAKPPVPEQTKPQASKPQAPSRAGTRFEEPIEANLDLYPFLEDHSIVNQPIGWADRDDIYPVIPLTMTMTLLADIAKKHAPGERVIKMSQITAMDFIVVNPPWHGVVQGFWRSENVLSLTIPGKIMMAFTMGTEAPPVPAEWVEKAKQAIGEPRMEPLSRAQVYDDYAFHRERFRSLIRSEEFGQNGFVNLITKREGMGSLLDQMGQSEGLFLHLYYTDNRVSFPVRVNEITFYQDMDDDEGVFTNYCVIRNVSDTFITADFIYTRDDKVWAIARGWANERIGIMNELWQVVCKPQQNVLAVPLDDNVFYAGYGGELPNRTTMVFLYLRYLSAGEKRIFNERPTPEAQDNFIAGRIALKDGLRMTLKNSDTYLYPIEFDTSYDDNGKVTVLWGDGRPMDPPIQVSISHKDMKGVAILSDHPVGIDIERLEAKEPSFWDLAFTPAEQELLHAQSDPARAAIQFWVAKEAYGKMLGTGLGGDPKKITVSSIDGDELTVGDQRIKTAERDGCIIGWTA